jgi:hypothetical protein
MTNRRSLFGSLISLMSTDYEIHALVKTCGICEKSIVSLNAL